MKKILSFLLLGLICSIGNLWAADYTIALSALTQTGSTYESAGLNSLKVKNYDRILVEVPSADASGTVSWKGAGNADDRIMYIYGSNGTVLDETRSFVYTSSYVDNTFTSADILTNDNKYYLVFSSTADWKASNVKYVLSAGGSEPEPGDDPTPVDPTITFNNDAYTVGGDALDLSTLFTSNSTGAVTYSVKTEGGTGAAIAGTSFTATAAGTAVVTASQAAAAGYNAKSVDANITVSAAVVPVVGNIIFQWVKQGSSGISADNTDLNNANYGSLQIGTSVLGRKLGSNNIDHNKAGYKFGNNDVCIEIQGTSDFQVGDTVIISGVCGGDGARSFAIAPVTTINAVTDTALTNAIEDKSTTKEYKVIVKAAQAGQKIRIFRLAGKTMYLSAIKVVRPAPAGPSITTQPVGASYITGAPIEALSVVAEASGTLSYQWYSCDDAEKTNAAEIDGATSASYTPEAAGFYYVVVTDDNGSVESDVVQIEISAAAAPVFTTDLDATANVTAGVAQDFAVEASGNPDPTYQWYKDGVAIDGATSAIYSYMAEMAGSVALHCVATNSQGSVNSTICTVTASLPAAPAITADLSSSANAFVGVSYKLGITAEGVGTLSYQWYMDGALIDGATESSYVYIPSQQGSHAIFCVVSNAGGDTFSEQCAVSASEPSYLSESVNNDIPEDFVMPEWMAYSSITTANTAGCSLNSAYEGGDNGVSGTDVLRLNNIDTLYFYIQCPGVLTISVSGTGTRKVRMETNGSELANSGDFKKNTLKTISGLVPAGTNVVKFHMVNANGGLTISKIVFTPSKLTAADTDFYGLYYEHEVAIPAGIEAFYGVLNNEEDELALTKIENVIPAETAVLVKAAAAGDYYFAPSATEAAAIAENSLKGVAEATTVASIEAGNAGKQVLTLGIAGGVVAFRQPAAASIAANKVYLLVDEEQSGAPVRIVMAEDNATAIDNIEDADNAVKFIENGVLYIRRAGVVYTTTGQVVR